MTSKFISLFCGCGGSSYGYQKSGFSDLLGIDQNPISCESYGLNFPNTEVWNRDIRKVSPKEILTKFGFKKGELDLLDSSPPCQGFSIAGKREILDTRNELFLHTKRFITGLLPKIFIIENVDGLLHGKMRGIFNHIIEELEKTPYRIKWKSLNSIYYGVPQSRQRVIIMGVRKDLGKEPVFPERENYIQYIGDVIPNIQFHSRGQFDKRLKSVDSLAYTITKTPSMFFVENGEKRKPTIDELKILQGFPKSFKLKGTYNEKWGMIGNSVPPPLTERIGKTIIKQIL
jgi:DNA (cytosine-5)-methyltransferase 1